MSISPTKAARADNTNAITETSVLQLLHRASQRATEQFLEDRTGFDITARQYAVLAAVAQYSGSSQTDIVDQTGIDRSTLADIMRRLVRRGFVHRRRTREDARAYALRLTELGDQALAAATPLAREADERVLALLSPAEREHLMRLLGTIVRGLEHRGSTATT
jgi:DNA-binding MarR family transcriptional regulator